MRTRSVRTPRSMVVTGMVGLASVCLLVAGCGSSKASSSPTTAPATTAAPASTSTSPSSAAGSSSSPSSTATTTAADKAFCALLSKYSAAENDVGNPTSLGAAKKDFATLVGQVASLAHGAPASLLANVKAAETDVEAIQKWIDTEATLKQLQGSATPAAVAKPFADLSKQGQAFTTWATAHCG